MKKPWKILIATLLTIAVLLLAGFVGLCIYASDYRTLDEEYYTIFEQDDVYMLDGMVYFEADSEIGFVFYPGGRVDYLAYAPLCEKLQEQGIQVFLVDMPFNMANFGVNKATAIMEEYTDITSWFIGGHSLGGVAASMYASANADAIDGLVLVGMYLAMDYDVEDTITINGSNDLRVGDSVDYTTNVYVIEGGNHAQFGNYGPNEGDGEATITADEQQDQATALIVAFMEAQLEAQQIA